MAGVAGHPARMRNLVDHGRVAINEIAYKGAMFLHVLRSVIRLPKPSHTGLPVLFALVTMPVLVLFALAVPAGEVPDEVAHIIRTDSVRHGEAAGFRRPRVDAQGDPAVDVAVQADSSLLLVGFAFRPGIPLAEKLMTKQRLDSLWAVQWADRLDAISIPNTAVYPPLLYLPAAVGLQVAKLSGAGPYASILFARLVNAALYLGSGALALGLALRGRMFLFAVLCLPMCLSLAASVNQDGPLIACVGLSTALLTRGTWRSWWSGVMLFGIAAMSKPYLLPLALVVPATMPGGLARQLGPAFGGLILAVGPAILWGAAMTAFVGAPFVRGPALPGGPLYAGAPGTMFPTTNPGEQLHILLAAPWRLVMLPLNSALAKGEWLWREGVGVIGALDVMLPIELYTAWKWALITVVAAGFVVPSVPERSRLLTLGATLVGLILAAWGVYMLEYLIWTRVGDAMVDGIQGRYFIPIAIFAGPMLAFPHGRPGPDTVLRAALSVPAMLVAVADVVVLPLVTLGAFYIR